MCHLCIGKDFGLFHRTWVESIPGNVVSYLLARALVGVERVGLNKEA